MKWQNGLFRRRMEFRSLFSFSAGVARRPSQNFFPTQRRQTSPTGQKDGDDRNFLNVNTSEFSAVGKLAGWLGRDRERSEEKI